MKKIFVSLSVVFVLSVLGVFGYFYQNPITKNVLDGNYDYKQTFEALVEEADIIAIVETKQDLRERKQQTSYLDEEKTAVEARWVMTDLNIKKIIKSNDSNVQKGEVIQVAEDFGFDGIYMKTMLDYVPLEKNEKYLVFLKKHPYGYYTIFDVNNGRYQLTGKENVNRGKFADFEKQSLKKFEKEIKASAKEEE